MKPGKILCRSSNKKKREEYSRSALRNSIERHLNNNGVTVKIAKNQVFQNSNKILDAKLRINRRAGEENVQHKPVIGETDLVKIRTSPFLSMTTPAGLLRRNWFYVSLYWCRRGREGRRDLRRDSFKFTHDANGREYAVMTHDEATKNHPGGENSKPSAERETRLYSTGADDDAFASLKLYVEKLNPSCSAFFQYPKPSGQSLAHYSSRPSVTQLESVSDTISNAGENNQPQSTELSIITKAPLIQSSNQMASNVTVSRATASFPSGFFNACNIQGNVQVFFGSRSRTDD